LLDLPEGVGEIFLVGDGNVTPHRIGTCRDPRHLLQGATSRGQKRSVFAEFFDQSRRKRGRNHLWNMADPRTKAVVIVGGQNGDAGANLVDPSSGLGKTSIVQTLAG